MPDAATIERDADTRLLQQALAALEEMERGARLARTMPQGTHAVASDTTLTIIAALRARTAIAAHVGARGETEQPKPDVHVTEAAGQGPDGDAPGAHHLTPAALVATIADLKSCAAGIEFPTIFNRDWRTWCSVLALQLDFLLDKALDGEALTADAVRYRWLRDESNCLSYTTDTGPQPSTPHSRMMWAINSAGKRTTDMIEIRLLCHHLGPGDEPIWKDGEHFDYAANMDAAIDAAAAGNGQVEGYKSDEKAVAASAAPASLGEVPQGWRSIESAPKDGTVLVLCRGERVTPGNWHEWSETASEYHSTTGEYLGQSEQDGGANWNSWDGGFTDEEPPTYWMPLPASPIPESVPPEGQHAQNWREAEAKVGFEVTRFIDRMNDLAPEDDAAKVLGEFLAAVNPIYAAIPSPAGQQTQGHLSGADFTNRTKDQQ